jgi:hypothetical protein
MRRQRALSLQLSVLSEIYIHTVEGHCVYV